MSTPVTPLLEPVVAEVVPEVPEVPEVVPVAPVIEQKRYSYQPTDEHNRPLGGVQVILYTTEQELAEKLVHQNVELIRKLREVTRDNRLGRVQREESVESDSLPPTIEFAEKPLTAEERYAISQDMNDPAKFEDARDRMFESAVGVKPKEFRDALNQNQLQTQQLLARQNAEEWMSRHPEFYVCPENMSTICDWMVKTGLPPTVKNFEIAQNKMTEAGLLLSSPIVREAPVAEVPVAEIVPKMQVLAPEQTRISEAPVPQEKRQSHVPSSLNNRVASDKDAITPDATAALTLQVIDKMSSEEYRKQITTNPAFVKRVNELEAARPPRSRR